MSSYYSKTAFEPPPRDRRKIDQNPARVPPHKKPRKYKLTVKYVRTTTEICTKEFTSNDAMREFRSRVERELAKQKAQKLRASYRWWGHWSSDLKMNSLEHQEFSEEPQISEELLD